MARKPGYRSKPLVVTLPTGKPFEILVTAHEWRKIYYRQYRAKLGHFHVGHSYLQAVRHCLRAPWSSSVSKKDAKTPRWAFVQAIPPEYRRAMILAVIEAWYEHKKMYVSVMQCRELKPPPCLKNPLGANAW